MAINRLIEKYFWTLNLVFLAAGAWLLAGTVNTVAAHKLRPSFSLAAERSKDTADPKTRQLVSNQIVVDRNLFDSALDAQLAGEEKDDQNEAAFDPTGEGQLSDLRAALVGTIVASDKKWSMAMITDLNKSETGMYRVSDDLMEDAKLVAILSRKVLLDRHGRLEYLELQEKGGTPATAKVAAAPPSAPSAIVSGIKKTGPSNWSIERQEVENALSNLNNIAMQARIVPSFTNGVADGFKLFAIRPGSLYSMLGIQNGDVIHKINGFKMDSPDKALEVYQKLKGARSIEIELTRMGKPEKLNYNIE